MMQMIAARRAEAFAILADRRSSPSLQDLAVRVLRSWGSAR